MRTWLALSRRRRDRAETRSREQHRHDLIRRLAPGRSFIDVGGMFEAAGDFSFLAEEAGATEVVLLDGMDPSDQFQRGHEERSSKVRYVQGDLHDHRLIDELGAFDVVWCTGVLYHTPNPYQQLEHLRALSGEWLVLGTYVIPEVPGLPGACLFYPQMPAWARSEWIRVHDSAEGRGKGLTEPFDETPMMGYANFWWGMTRSALRSMLNTARFEIAEEAVWGSFLTDLLARPIDAQSVIPPVEFARRRGEERQAGFAGDAMPEWAMPRGPGT